MKTKYFLNQLDVKEEIKSRFYYDEISGNLYWKPRERLEKHKQNTVVGSVTVGRDGYKHLSINLVLFGRKINLIVSRIIWLIKTNKWPTNTIDHVNKNSLDNSWKNLRDVTQAENNQNKNIYKKSLGFRGVSKHNGKFWSRFASVGVTYRLGHYDTREEAARAYDKKALEILGSKANLNFPLDESPRSVP